VPESALPSPLSKGKGTAWRTHGNAPKLPHCCMVARAIIWPLPAMSNKLGTELVTQWIP